MLAVLVWAGAFHVGFVQDLDALLHRAALAVRDSAGVLDALTIALVSLIEPLVYALICLVIVLAGGRGARAVAAAATLVGANVTTQVLKPLLAEPRFHDSLLRQVFPESWPSGHATAAFAALFAALLVAPPERRRTVLVAGGCVAAGVAVSVVARRWHYPSDSLGGLLVAGAWASAAAAWLSSRRPAPAATGAPRRRWLRATG